ncbi:hypothetical protein BKA80DRAFT_264854 [Phyllosticta citrichinensis]
MISSERRTNGRTARKLVCLCLYVHIPTCTYTYTYIHLPACLPTYLPTHTRQSRSDGIDVKMEGKVWRGREVDARVKTGQVTSRQMVDGSLPSGPGGRGQRAEGIGHRA